MVEQLEGLRAAFLAPSHWLPRSTGLEMFIERDFFVNQGDVVLMEEGVDLVAWKVAV